MRQGNFVAIIYGILGGLSALLFRWIMNIIFEYKSKIKSHPEKCKKKYSDNMKHDCLSENSTSLVKIDTILKILQENLENVDKLREEEKKIANNYSGIPGIGYDKTEYFKGMIMGFKNMIFLIKNLE